MESPVEARFGLEGYELLGAPGVQGRVERAGAAFDAEPGSRWVGHGWNLRGLTARC